MTRFAIVEDDASFRQQLGSFLERFCTENGLKYDVTVFSDGGEIACGYQPVYDIILMDIQMQEVDGMTAAHRIRALDNDVLIIFITNMTQFAIEGYAVDALDYLLKPLTYYAFSQCMHRALTRLKKREKKSLFVVTREGGRRVDSDEIYYIEVHGHSLVYHLASGDVEAGGAMKDVEEALGTLPFFRCNKCDLVNLAKVDGVQDGDAVVNGQIVQVSRAKKKPFLEALNRYINEVRA